MSKLLDLSINITDGEHGTVKNHINGNYYLLSNKNIINGKIVITDSERKINKETFEKINKRTKMEKGDLVISTVGTIGKTAIIKETNPNYVFQRSVGIIKVDNNKINNYYLKYQLDTNEFQNRLIKLSKGAIQKCLYISDLENLEIKIISKEEQDKVVAILKLLDDIIERNNEFNEKIDRIVKKIYDYWFLQFEFPNEEGKPYKSSGGKMVWNEQLKREIPEIFDVEKIEDIITIKDGTHESPKYVDNGKYLITSKHLDKLGIKFDEANFINEKDFEKINARSKVDKGDILFSMIGALGNVYMIDEDIINFAIKNVALYKTSEKIELGSYIFTTLQSILMRKYIQTTMLGSIQKFIPLGRLRQMPLLYNKNIILKFNENTKCMFELQSKLKKETMKLTKLRNYLLPLLINGQVKI